jgi:hypothetical protein
MRYIGALILFTLAIVAFHPSSGEVALLLWGREVTATISSVSKNATSGRRSAYTAHYEFATQDMSKGYGSCPSHRGAEGHQLRIRYLPQDPSWNAPDATWYSIFWVLLYGGAAWPLALWSARTVLNRRLRRLGEDDDDDDDDDAADDDDADTAAAAAKPATETGAAASEVPAKEIGPVPFRNRWSAAVLFSLVLALAAIALNLAWFEVRAAAAVRSEGAAREQVPAASPAAAEPRGATAGNIANNCDLGFDGDALYFAVWRDYDTPNALAPGLYRSALDGSDPSPVGKPGDTAGIYGNIQVLGDWVYFVGMEGVHRIRKDGTGVRRLTKNNVTAMAVVGDWIYYQHKVLDGAIYRMRLDGGGDGPLAREAVGAMCVADDGWIYYANETDGGRLWRMRNDGAGRARLSDQRVARLLVAGGWIWFADPGRNSALSRMALDGTGAEVIAEDSVHALNWADGRIYFNRNNGEVARCRPDGSEFETVAPAAIGILIHGEHLFVRPSLDARSFRRSALDGSQARGLRL